MALKREHFALAADLIEQDGKSDGRYYGRTFTRKYCGWCAVGALAAASLDIQPGSPDVAIEPELIDFWFSTLWDDPLINEFAGRLPPVKIQPIDAIDHVFKWSDNNLQSVVVAKLREFANG